MAVWARIGRVGLLNKDGPGWPRKLERPEGPCCAVPGTPSDVSTGAWWPRSEEAWDRASLGLVKGGSDSGVVGAD